MLTSLRCWSMTINLFLRKNTPKTTTYQSTTPTNPSLRPKARSEAPWEALTAVRSLILSCSLKANSLTQRAWWKNPNPTASFRTNQCFRVKSKRKFNTFHSKSFTKLSRKIKSASINKKATVHNQMKKIFQCPTRLRIARKKNYWILVMSSICHRRSMTIKCLQPSRIISHNRLKIFKFLQLSMMSLIPTQWRRNPKSLKPCIKKNNPNLHFNQNTYIKVKKWINPMKTNSKTIFLVFLTNLISAKLIATTFKSTMKKSKPIKKNKTTKSLWLTVMIFSTLKTKEFSLMSALRNFTQATTWLNQMARSILKNK